MHFNSAGFLLLASLALGACAPVHSNAVYSREELGRAATVMKGVVLAVREVTVSGTNSGVGAGAGAAAGAAAGSSIGGGTRANIIGAIGGAVVGGVAGAVAEQSLTQAGAKEIVIQQDNGQVIAVVQVDEENLKAGDRVLVLRAGKVRVVQDTMAQATPAR